MLNLLMIMRLLSKNKNKNDFNFIFSKIMFGLLEHNGAELNGT